MSDQTVARRYAQALYEQADENGEVDAIDEDVRAVQQSLEDSRELTLLFERPIVQRAKKRAVVEELFEGRVEPLTLRFLKLLIKKKRDALVSDVMRTYRALRDEQRGVVTARVRTALPLDDTEREKLKSELEDLTGQTVRLETRQDESLIGGVVVRIGDTVYDGSARHQLESLRDRMEEQALSDYSGDGAPTAHGPDDGPQTADGGSAA
jgi:F-type H+-transporting ATPase subunit delta